MRSHGRFLAVLATVLAVVCGSAHGAVIGGFEGNLNAGPFGAWQTNHAAFDPSPEVLPGF